MNPDASGSARDSAWRRDVEEAQARARMAEAERLYGDAAMGVLRAELTVTKHLLEMKGAELRLIELELQWREVEWLPATAAIGVFLRRAMRAMVLASIDQFFKRGAVAV